MQYSAFPFPHLLYEIHITNMLLSHLNMNYYIGKISRLKLLSKRTILKIHKAANQTHFSKAQVAENEKQKSLSPSISKAQTGTLSFEV